MFANVVGLEFTKQRKAFLSAIVLAAIFLFFVFVDCLIHSRNVIEVMRDIIGYFALMGVAGLLILTGPVAGAQLRSESLRNAEEPLPFSPIQKVFGAYLTSLFYVLIGGIFFFGLVLALNSLDILDLTLGLVFGKYWTLRIETLLFISLQFHLLAFLFAYWLNQAVLGTALAGLIVGSEIAILLQTELLRDVFWFSFSRSSWFMLVLFGIIAGLIGAIVGLAIIAKRIERSSRIFFWPGFAVSIATTAGSLALFMGFCITSYKLQNQLVPANLSWPNRLIQDPAPQTKGAFFTTMSGDIVRITPQSRTVLRNTGFKLDPKKNFEIVSHDLSGETSYFLLKKDVGKYEIWKAEDDKFESYFIFLSSKVVPEFMFKCDDGFCLYSFSNNEKFIVFSKLSLSKSQNQNIGWERLPIPNGSYGFSTIVNHVLQPKLDRGQAARLSASKNILTRSLPDKKVLQWNLPGSAVTPKFLSSIVLPAYEKNGEPYFVIPVTINNKTSFVVCSPDGSIKPAWNDSWPSSYEVSPRIIEGGGIVWVRWQDKNVELRVVGNDGTFYGPITVSADAAFVWPSVLKMEGSVLWLLLGKNLKKIDLIHGKVLFDSGALAEHVNYWNYYSLIPYKEGMYFIRDKRICLIDWNGKIRDLGPASVN